MKLTPEQSKELFDLTKKLAVWLNENADPHCEINITQSRVSISQELAGFPIPEEVDASAKTPPLDKESTYFRWPSEHPCAKDNLTGAERIQRERQRQIESFGFTPGRDDEYVNSELALAAACYLSEALDSRLGELPPNWPWNLKWWKPSARKIRNLEKAGALIAAEIDRVARVESSKGVMIASNITNG